MKILVTGAAGFIGMHLCNHLLELGHSVLGVDNFNNSYSNKLKYHRIENIKHESFIFETGDITDDFFIRWIFDKHHFDVVYHLAGQAGIANSSIDPSSFTKDNLVGFSKILQCCRLYNIKHLLFASSSSVYDKNPQAPSCETDNTDSPKNYYAATKKSCETMAASYAFQYDMKITALRIFTQYGPWGRPDMAHWKFADAILNETPLTLYNHGNITRDFMYVGDTVKMISKMIDLQLEGMSGFQIFNIGASQPIKVITFVNGLELLIGKPGMYEFKKLPKSEAKSTNADMGKYHAMIDSTPDLTSLESGLKQFLDWFINYNNNCLQLN